MRLAQSLSTHLKAMCILLVVGVVLCELTLRVMGRWYLQRFYQQSSTEQLERRDVILCLGESSTAGLWCKFEDSYPKQLERLLNERFRTDRYLAVVPPHVGQNTSQMLNRMDEYLQLYRPRLVILMAGANNGWSLAENHVVKFFKGSLLEEWQLRSEVWLYNFRTYKLLCYLGARLLSVTQRFEPRQYLFEMLGHPTLCPFPNHMASERAARHKRAFVNAWHYDMKNMIQATQRCHTPVLMMTYPIPPNLIPVEEYVALAQESQIPITRNDLLFSSVMKEATFRSVEYFHRDKWHPKPRGYQLIAENAFVAIVQHGLLPDLDGS